RGVVHVLHPDEAVAEPAWKVDRLSLHYSCAACPAGTARAFEELTPQHFSFNSPIGWCPACEGLGIERGTNIAALIPNPNLTLSEGAIAAWPDPQSSELFRAILDAMHAELGLPLDVPYYRLDPRHQRIVLYGTGERWLEVKGPGLRAKGQGAGGVATSSPLPLSPQPLALRLQYKGLYPAIEEASRVSFSARQRLMDMVGETACSVCQGARVRDDAATVRLNDITLPHLCRLPLSEVLARLRGIKLDRREKQIAGDLLHEATHRLTFLVDVGLHYLTLDRTMPTLSGGESQRIRLAGQIGRALTGVLYVLDEPTIGLHPRDNGRLVDALIKLRDLGNTVLLVEHDREVIEAADRLYDFGPGAGRLGGRITAAGTPAEISNGQLSSLTGDFLSGRRGIAVPHHRRIERVSSDEAPHPDPLPKGEGGRRAKPQANSVSESKIENRKSKIAESRIQNPESKIYTTPPGGGWLELAGCRQNNLRNVDLHIPLGTLTCITGVSGSGKSSLIGETLARAVARKLHRATETPGPHEALRGVERLNKVIVVDQQPLGTTPASNPATYTGVFDQIRELFARVSDSKIRGYRPGRFSFNRPGGRCEDCEGLGQKKIEMHFLPDVWVECSTCRGQRYNQETLAVKYRGHSIADVLNMSIGQALELFGNIPAIRTHLATLAAIGLDYLTLGQSAPTLSGGEAQRIKLAAELVRPHGGKTLYLLDEPTTGLHFDDIAKLLKVLNSLVEQGNTVVIIEHNLDVIKTADWIVDIGPEAGVDGGWIVAAGTPEEVVRYAEDSGFGIQDSGKRTAGGRGWTERSEGSPGDATPRLRSYTGELLAPLLAAEHRGDIEIYDAAQAASKQAGDLELRHVGRDASQPWQTDGRQWHTRDRLAHSGKPCRWEGAALDMVIDTLAADKRFAPVNWNHRSIVEVLAAHKTGGWFLHAQTGEEWVLTLRFRVKKGTFDAADLNRRLGLTPLDDLDELPVYGRGDRVKVKNAKGPFQEVTISVHWKREVDTPAFRAFLKEACEAYFALVERAALNPDDLSPWKVLGRKWHLSRKGFPSHKRVAWEPEVLDELVAALEKAFPNGRYDWSNKQVVYVFAGDSEQPWAELHTKRRGGIDLTLLGEPGKFALGRIATLGAEREVAAHRSGREAVWIRIDAIEQVRAPALREFLVEHIRSTDS
ncbi:MAG: ATP-binding cassette domain-containing protein, partial [Planctomycetaceae bacterium]|nr:ATP-binding cassette domain-containing protein [Planctomycetaceae bacterium]